MEYNEIAEEEVYLTKNGKPRKRKPKKKNVYFTQETEDAIIAYVSEENPIRRDRIYNEKIHYAFYKLAENIIHTFKFYYTEVDDIEDLKYEVISFLIQKLHLFNHSKFVNDKLNKIINREKKEKYENGSFVSFTNNSSVVSQETISEFIRNLDISEDCKLALSEISPPKAYSYFGTIAKRYLILYNKKNYKKLKSQYSLEDLNEDSETFNQFKEEAVTNEIDKENLLDDFLKKMDDSLFDSFSTEEEVKIANAIITVFKKKDKIDIINKKAFFVYVKEITDSNSSSITKVIKSMRKKYFAMLNDRLENYDE
jgi:hypothetical protein